MAFLNLIRERKAENETDWVPSDAVVHIIYDGTPYSSLLRTALVDIYAQFVAGGMMPERYPDEFNRELLVSLISERAPQRLPILEHLDNYLNNIQS